MLRVLNRAFDHPMDIEESAAMPLAGGIMQYGYQCGMIWGATLAAGAQAYRLFGPGPVAETSAVIAGQRLVASFRELNNDINCIATTGIDRSSSAMEMMIFFLIKGGTVKCFRKAVAYANEAYDNINAAFLEKHFEPPLPPASCTAELARRMGASALQTTMAAGLAGGIGLSGGACGALGAAIWLMGINRLNEGGRKLDIKSPITLALIDRFLKCTDYEFECCEITGRHFEDINAHENFTRNGGCSKIIELLAAD